MLLMIMILMFFQPSGGLASNEQTNFFSCKEKKKNVY